MNLVVDLATLSIKTPTTPFFSTSGKTATFNVQFMLNGIPQQLSEGSTGYVGITVSDNLVAGGSTDGVWTSSGSGSSSVYSSTFSMNTTEVVNLFSGENAPEMVMGVITVDWLDSSNDYETSPFPITIYKANITGGEGTPSELPDFKATTEQAQAGTDDSHWMTPLKTSQAIAAKATGDIESQLGYTPTSPSFVSSAISTAIAALSGVYTTASAVASQIAAHGYQTASQVTTAITSYGYQTASQVSSSIATALNGYDTISARTSAISALSSVYTTTAAVASQISSALSGYATQSWVSAQGFITGSPFNQSLNTGDSATFQQIEIAGSASFANGAATIDASGNLHAANYNGLANLFPLGSSAYADGGTGANPARYIVQDQSSNVIGYVNLSWDGSPTILIGIQATDVSGNPLTHGTFAMSYDGSGNLTSVVCSN